MDTVTYSRTEWLLIVSTLVYEQSRFYAAQSRVFRFGGNVVEANRMLDKSTAAYRLGERYAAQVSG